MNQITLNVDNYHIADFLNILQSLNYIEVKKIKKTAVEKSQKKGGQSANTALLAAAKPIRASVTLAELAKEQGYVKTDWQRLEQLAKSINIQEPIEELFAQLKA